MGARLAVLCSGSGTNLQALVDAHARGDLTCEIVLVVSNVPESGALARAARHGIPQVVVDRHARPSPTKALKAVLEAHAVEVVVLAGWLALVDPSILSRYPGRVLNIHPGPLPRFGGKGMYGRHVHEAVLAAGVPRSGATVHLVDEEYDHGPVLAHRAVDVREGDTPERLAERVLQAEHDLYWRVIQDRFG